MSKARGGAARDGRMVIVPLPGPNSKMSERGQAAVREMKAASHLAKQHLAARRSK